MRDWNLLGDGKIPKTQEIMTLFKLYIPKFFRLFFSYLAGPLISIYYPLGTLTIPWL